MFKSTLHTVLFGLLPLLLGSWLFASSQTKPAPAKKVDFASEILPIFKAHCFGCHGADKQQGELRLDNPKDAFKGGDSGQVILPGNSRESLLVKHITGEVEPRMPMKAAPLTDKQIALIRAWIDQGAVWTEARATQHWAFIPPKRPPLPKVNNRNWARNGIDYFILARLEKEGLKPSPEADKITLIRRVSLDLTGIPPTPAEVDAFLKDKSPDAYEKVVDRLLASPRYGERMAMDWMDYARYADSNGYQADYERFQWRWRDWVIDAFNNNMPYDKFTIEQIAGDLLPNATLSQRIATGFNRNHRINTEGGVIAEEWRVENVVDRVETTSEVWLGLTMGCARCHDHKYDPISQKEFYQFFAYFNNVPESGTGEERPVNHPPLLKAPTPEQEKALSETETRLAQMDEQRSQRLLANAQAASEWKAAETANGHAESSLMNGIEARYVLSSQPFVVAGNAPKPAVTGQVLSDPGKATGAVVTSEGNYLDLGKVGDFEKNDAFSYGAWVNPKNGNGVPLSRMDSRMDFRGWDLFLSGGRPMVHLINQWPSNAIRVDSKETIPNNQWTHLFVTYDGSGKPEGIKLYINGKSVAFDVAMNTLTESIKTGVSTKIGTRTGSDAFNGKVDDVAIFKRALTPEEVTAVINSDPANALLAIPPDQRTPEQKQTLLHLWCLRNDPDYQKIYAEQETLTKKRAEIESQISTVMVMEEMPQPRDCYVLIRGQYDKRGEKVTAKLPAFLPAIPPGKPNNRLGLAYWLVSPRNPLTARVTVNRLWEKFFGTGIVSTVEDFGTRGDKPSHPELLDWLATEFVRLKWDLKAFQKTIVMSATYRQSSAVSPALLKRDPQNRLLARGPRFRLPAEIIRDQALAASGLLVEKVGGPSVRPYQPEGIWDETNVYGNLRNYQHDKGEGLYRRSLYTIWKRTAAPPNMTLFDVPGREMCRTRRARTNTPLQALALMNEITYVEAARVLAEKAILHGGNTPQKRIAYAFRRALGRYPNPQEMKILTQGFQKRFTKYKTQPDAALQLVRVGETPHNPKLNPVELAAYTLTTSVILNMDEMITKE